MNRLANNPNSGIIRLAMGVLFMIVMGLVGCHHRPAPPSRSALSLGETLARYNGNLTALGGFSAQISQWRASYYDEGKKHRINESGGKLFFAPADAEHKKARLSLRASASFYPLKALILGSNGEDYWMIVTPQKYGWWGRYEHLDKPCGAKLPLSPQQVLDLAGLTYISDNPAKSPYPIFKAQAEQYILGTVYPTADGLKLRQEIIINRATNRPAGVRLYDRRGRCVGRSELSEYIAFNNGWLPSRLRLFFIDEQGHENLFELKLARPKALKEIHPLLFQRPEEPAELDSYIQIDKDCDEN